jgi:ketosteroid isomerase-like protein
MTDHPITHPIVVAYAAAIDTGDLTALVALFDPDATLVHPIGTYDGIGAIRDFYEQVVLAGQARLTIGDVLTDGTVVMAEIAATSPLDPNAGTAHAVDVFRLVGNGRIGRLEIYYR